MKLFKSTQIATLAVFVSLVLSGSMLIKTALATPYSSLVLSKNPVSYWRLGESSGTSAADEAGSNTGTYVNTPTLGVTGLITDDADTAVRFDPGSSEIVNAGNDPSLHFGGAMTVTAWINADTLPSSGVYAIAGQWDNVIAQDRFLLSLRTTGQLGLAIGDGSSAVTASRLGTSTVTPGERHFVAFTYVDGAPGTITMYFDGNIDPLSSAQSPVPTILNTGSSVDFRIGGQVTGGGRYFDGIIDEVAVFDSALSSADIQQLYLLGANGPVVPEPSSLLLLGIGACMMVRRARKCSGKA